MCSNSFDHFRFKILGGRIKTFTLTSSLKLLPLRVLKLDMTIDVTHHNC